MRKCTLAARTLLVLGLLLVACAPAAPAPAPKPAPTVAPAAPTPTPKPSPTPLPTSVVAAPTSTVAPAAPTPAPKPAVEKPRQGGVLLFAVSGDLATLDPHTHTVAILAHTILANYSNLVWYDPSDLSYQTISGDLATRWEMSPDGTVYTFHPRKDAKFHDGQPVTAEDVKFSLERIISPPKGMASPRKEDLFAVKSVEAPDDYTVRITLSYPSASFISFLAGPYIVMVPKRFLEKEGNDALKKKALGSGPFIYKSYQRGVSYEMARNPNYYKPGLPYLDGVRAFIIPDAAARLAAFRTRQIVMLRTRSAAISGRERELLLKEMGDKIVADAWTAISSSVFFFPNNKWGPFKDVRVRQAVAMGIYKQGMFDIVFGKGLGQVSGPMPSKGPWGLPEAELVTYPGYEPDMKARIARAKELLAQAGYTEQKPLEFEVSTRSDASYFRGTMEYVVSELPKIGIKARAKPMEQGAWYNDLTEGTFQAAAGGTSVSTGDPDSFIGTLYYSKGGRNYAHVNDPKVDELFEKQARTIDPQQRKELVWEIQRILLREAYWPVFGQIPALGVWYSSVRGNIESTAAMHNVKYEDVWLAE